MEEIDFDRFVVSGVGLDRRETIDERKRSLSGTSG
jgi:hypothetical protein